MQRKPIAEDHLAELAFANDIRDVRFFAVGYTVMVRTPTSEGCWCTVQPLHVTKEADWTARRRAEQTAVALNEMYAGLAKLIDENNKT